jgi:hypothetical protein
MRSAVPVLDRRHVGEEQQRVRVQLAAQQRGGQVGVHDRFHPTHGRGAFCSYHRDAAASADHDHLAVERHPDGRQVQQFDRLGDGTTRRHRVPSWRTSQRMAKARTRA